MKIAVSEFFYSIQGEGPSAGIPAVFCRLQGCNLSCGGAKTIQSGIVENGASWRCDSIEVWTKGITYTIQELLSTWKENGLLEKLKEGARLIITGGEPLLQSKALGPFLSALQKTCERTLYIELETNGCFIPPPELDNLCSQYNLSPKLSNSGMPLEKRIVPDALCYFAKSKKTRLKLVVSREKDLKEFESEIQHHYKFKTEEIYLMPASDTKKNYLKSLNKVLILSKKYHYQVSPRLQLQLWDQKTGV